VTARRVGLPVTLDAIVVDVDGTLYRQSPVRRAIVWRLVRSYWTNPERALTTLRVLSAYRRAQEALRACDASTPDLYMGQVKLAARWTETGEALVQECVHRWMEQEPLSLLRPARRAGLLEFLDQARQDAVRLAVFSDYPAVAKLEALEVSEFFDVVLSAHDPDVGRFKPDPLGIDLAIERLGVERKHVLYIGDRPDVDAAAARRAGVACIILGRRASAPGHPWVGLSGFPEVRRSLFSA
jgi:HAD superfamily hydrolase (TIGR01549 family)